MRSNVPILDLLQQEQTRATLAGLKARFPRPTVSCVSDDIVDAIVAPGGGKKVELSCRMSLSSKNRSRKNEGR